MDTQMPNNIPVSADRGNNVEGNELECPICMTEMVNPVRGTLCEHNFCDECLESWIRTKHSATELATCPMCRSILTEADLLALQLVWDPDLMVQLLDREENFNFINDV